MADWLTAEDRDTVEALWPDAAGILSDDVLGMYLAAAKAACLAYAPALPTPGLTIVDGIIQQDTTAGVPDEYRLAQVMQARNTYNAAQASPGGEFDGGGYGITAYPLDGQVRQLLRPRQGVGAIL